MRKILATTFILLISTVWLAAHSGSVNLTTGTGIADKRDVAEALGVRPGDVDDLAPGLTFTLSDGVCTRTLISTPQYTNAGKLYMRFSFWFSGFSGGGCELEADAVLEVNGMPIW